ncbi:MAG: type VI secretion system lipoprotein IglE [Francisellaceae bacterium]
MWFLKYCVLSLIILGGCGCASNTFNLTVDSGAKANGGQPLYVYVKDNDWNDFLGSDPSQVYSDFMNNEIQNRLLIIPARKSQEFTINKSPKEGLTLFFIFKNIPISGKWKIYLTKDEQQDMTIDIDDNDLISMTNK